MRAQSCAGKDLTGALRDLGQAQSHRKSTEQSCSQPCNGTLNVTHANNKDDAPRQGTAPNPRFLVVLGGTPIVHLSLAVGPAPRK
eukprot:3841227-Alexandrium_andersonii.AAC.1